MENQKIHHRPVRWANLRLREEEHMALLQAQERLHLSRSQLVRNMIRDGLGVGPALLPEESNILRELAYQVGAVGRNFNQLLRAIHSGKVTALANELALVTAIRDQIVGVEKEIQTVITRSKKRSVIHEP